MTGEPRASEQQKARVREQFGATAQSYVTSRRHASGPDLQRLVELAECTPEAEALDIATGGGHTALALAPHVRHVVASDLTPQMLEAAADFIHGHGVTNVTFEVADAEHLPFANACFDIVSCRIAPHHFADVRAFCREVARVLRPGGRFVLIDSWSAEEDELDRFINDIEWRRDSSHARSYRLSEWRATIAETGLVVDVVEPFERRHDFAEWTARSRMDAAEREALERTIRDAPEHVRRFFGVALTPEGCVESFTDHKFLLQARKPAA
jgi:ubiquinone/menaquinone biosynthesis C-methylase UbiE